MMMKRTEILDLRVVHYAVGDQKSKKTFCKALEQEPHISTWATCVSVCVCVRARQ